MALRIIPFDHSLSADEIVPLLREIGAERIVVVPHLGNGVGAIAVDGDRVPEGDGPLHLLCRSSREGDVITYALEWVRS